MFLNCKQSRSLQQMRSVPKQLQRGALEALLDSLQGMVPVPAAVLFRDSLHSLRARPPNPSKSCVASAAGDSSCKSAGKTESEASAGKKFKLLPNGLMSLYKMPQLCTYSSRSIILGLGSQHGQLGSGKRSRLVDRSWVRPGI